MSHRGSGRTTRMLAESMRLAGREGRYVFVIGASREHAEQLFRTVLDGAGAVADDPEASVRTAGCTRKLYVGKGSITFEPAGPQFDWHRLRPNGIHPDCSVLVDHHAIEIHLAAALEMLHAFDASGEGPRLRSVEAL